MLNRLIRFFARRAYKAGYADGYSAGRASKQQQSYVRGYSDGKIAGRCEKEGTIVASKAKLDEAYKDGWQDALIAQADATAGSSQGYTTKSA